MKTFFSLSLGLALVALLACSPRLQAAAAAATTITAVESPELAKARAQLLDAYTAGSTDDDAAVKRMKAEIARLEYISVNRPARGETPGPLFSVDFPGGSVSALLALLAKSGPDAGLNIVGEKSDLVVELPPLSVRNTDAAAFASALDGILRSRSYTLESNRRPTAPNQAPVYVLRKMTTYEISGGRGSNNPFSAYQLAPYTESQSIDDIIGAIRAAWELDPQHSPDAMRLKYHPPTGILLVSCPPDGLNLVGRVLNELRRAAPPAPKSPPAPKMGVPPAAETR